jgi:hypothetical protein
MASYPKHRAGITASAGGCLGLGTPAFLFYEACERAAPTLGHDLLDHARSLAKHDLPGRVIGLLFGPAKPRYRPMASPDETM